MWMGLLLCRLIVLPKNLTGSIVVWRRLMMRFLLIAGVNVTQPLSMVKTEYGIVLWL